MSARLPDVRVFVSGSMDNRAAVKELAAKLRLHKLDVLSMWHDRDVPTWTPFNSIETAQKAATEDLTAILQSEWFIQLSSETIRSTTGAMDVAFGFALGLKRQMILIGPRYTPAHFLPVVKQYDKVEDFLQAVTIARVKAAGFTEQQMKKGPRFLMPPGRGKFRPPHG